MTLKQVQKAHRDLQAATAKAREKRVALRVAIHSARETDHFTLNEIGQALGMTRQGVYDILRR